MGALLACGDTDETTGPPALPLPASPVPGQSYFGRNGYVEYIAGNAPVIFTAPHGGGLRPTEAAVRSCGTVVGDANTQELARTVASAYHARFGRYPHIVINRLHRDRLDANRDSLEAGCGGPVAGAAWREFHDYIETARQRVVTDHGRGFLVDLHGHGHPIPRLELGYLISGASLDAGDSQLNANSSLIDASSIQAIARRPGAAPLASILRGPLSLGTLLQAAGFRSVPSASDTGPAGAEYFSGGYITERHGCRAGGGICAVQLEANLTGVRDSEANRDLFSRALVGALREFLLAHWSLSLG